MKQLGSILCTFFNFLKENWKQAVALIMAALLLAWLLLVPHEPYTLESADRLYRLHRKMFDELGEYLMCGAVPPGSYFDSWAEDLQYAGIEIPPVQKWRFRLYHQLPIHSGSHVIRIIGSETGQVYSVLFTIYFEYRDDGFGVHYPVHQALWYFPNEGVTPIPDEGEKIYPLPSGGSKWYLVSKTEF